MRRAYRSGRGCHSAPAVAVPVVQTPPQAVLVTPAVRPAAPVYTSAPRVSEPYRARQSSFDAAELPSEQPAKNEVPPPYEEGNWGSSRKTSIRK
jgi:hypothetical protein